MTATGHILETAILDLCGVIRVARTGSDLQIVIVTGADVGVVNYSGNRCATGIAINNTGQKFRVVCFLAGSSPRLAAGRSSIQKTLQLLQIHRKSGRNSVKCHANGRAVRLTKDIQF